MLPGLIEEKKETMLPTFALMLLQNGMAAKQPGYFAPVLLGSLVAGGVGWLIAAVSTMLYGDLPFPASVKAGSGFGSAVRLARMLATVRGR